MSYVMDRSDVVGFANSIGEYKERGEEITLKYCPYCQGGNSRDTWTFSINFVSGAFCCQRASCEKHGHFVELCRDFDFDIGLGNERTYKTLPQPNGKIEPHESAVAYFESRGISRETVERYQVTARKDAPNIIVFPFFNEHNELKFIKYRNLLFKKGMKGSKEWAENDTLPILFGMQEATDYDKPLIITEGQIDSLTVAECGIANAVSVPTGANGFTWIQPCMEFLNHFDSIIVFGDYEKGKITVIDGLRTRLKTKSIKCVRKIDYLGEKDANDILRKYGKDAIRTCIKNACYPAVEQVKDLSEVESVDLDALPKMFTGITEIDRTLGGGIAYGQLLLLTGKRGDGKSTFMSQLVCSALQQNVNTFIYSGELPDYHVKRWLDYQLAGADYLTAREDRFGDTYYVLDNAVVDAITAWYKGRCKIFDNGFIPNDKSEMESLLDIIEKTILAYDIKLVCIDNLMTAMDTVEKQDDLYLSQSNFVGRLKKIAMQYDCAVILVAHPRKSKESFSNDDVSGSSDITNKADIVMSYARNDDDPQANSKLVITKNRLTGKLMYGKNAIPLRYSAKTKRISGGEIYKYDWIKLLPKELVQESTQSEAVQTTAFFTEINEELPF